MKRNKFIAWLLVVVSMVMLTASVMPHHHHQDFLCMHSSMSACDCACESGEHSMNDTSCSHGHQGCDANCVTNFQTINPEDADVELSDEAFCSLFYAWAETLLTPSPLLDVKVKYESLYLEKLSITCQPHVMGLRAPPCLCA